jgi:transposase-like protein
MGQVLHGSARTTAAIRRAIQDSQESLRVLALRHGINPKTVAKWKKRRSVEDRRTGPREPRSTVLSIEDEAVIVAFRRHTLLPLDDCLYALQATIPHLTRSSLHRCLQRHGISRLPEVDGEKPTRKTFKSYPIGYFHIDLAEVRTAAGKLYLYVAIDRTSKFAYVEVADRANTMTSLRHPHNPDRQWHSVCHSTEEQGWSYGTPSRTPIRPRLLAAWDRTPPDQTEASVDQWAGRAHEPDHQGSNSQTVSL